MAGARRHAPSPAADRQLAARVDRRGAVRDRTDIFARAPAAPPKPRRLLRGAAEPSVVASHPLRAIGCVLGHAPPQSRKLRRRHEDLASRLAGEPACGAGMVDVMVGHEQPLKPRPPADALQERLPVGARARIVDAGIDGEEAVAVAQQERVDVVEGERKREPGPENAVEDLDHLTRRGRLGERKLCHERRSGGDPRSRTSDRLPSGGDDGPFPRRPVPHEAGASPCLP